MQGKPNRWRVVAERLWGQDTGRYQLLANGYLVAYLRVRHDGKPYVTQRVARYAIPYNRLPKLLEGVL